MNKYTKHEYELSFGQRMGAKENLLSQRARLAFWSPLLILILFVVAENSAWAVEDRSTIIIIDDNEDKTQAEVSYHDDRMYRSDTTKDDLEQPGFGFSVEVFNFTREFDLQDNLETDYESIDNDEMDDLIDLAESVESDYNWIQMFIVISLLVMLILVKNPFKGSELVNGKSILGSALLLISLFALLATLTVFSGLEEVMNEMYEDGFDDVNSGFYGSAISTDESGDDSFEIMLTWGPGIAFWSILGVFVISLLGGLANLSYLKKDLIIEDAPVWFKSDDAPAWFDKSLERLPVVLLGLATLSVLIAAFAPWYTVDQTWNLSETEQADELTEEGVLEIYLSNSTSHEISWKLTPWNVIHTNDTFLEEGFDKDSIDNATTSTEMTSYSNQPFIDDSGENVMGMRWPMLCATLLLIGGLVLNFSEKLQQKIKGNMKGWFLLTSVLVMLVMTLGTSDFEKDMVNSVEDDLSKLAPIWDLVGNVGFFTEDSFFGDEITGEFTGSSDVGLIIIESSWGPSIGYYAAQIAPLLIVSGLLLMYGGEIVTVLENRKLPKFDFENSEWSSRPTIICIVALVVVAGLGTGMGNTLVDPAFSAPAGMYKWELDSSTSSSSLNSGSITLTKDETHVFELMPLEHYSENLTDISFFIACDEGDEGSNDNADELDWRITPPAAATTNGNTLSGTISCEGFFSEQIRFNSVFDIPDEVWAEDEKMAISQATFEVAYTGKWILTLDAVVNDGDEQLQDQLTGADTNDDNLQLSYDIGFQGRVGLTAEKL